MLKTTFSYENLLSTVLRDNTGKIAAEIQTRYPNIRDLTEATTQDLEEIKGIGPVAAKQILACVEFGKNLASPNLNAQTKITMPSDVFQILGPEMRTLEKEVFRILVLNTKNHVLKVETVSVGTANSSLAVPREIFKVAVRTRTATSIILIHNHPSGVPDESLEDISITKRIVEAGKIIGIEVLDHVIIGETTYVSFKEKGLL